MACAECPTPVVAAAESLVYLQNLHASWDMNSTDKVDILPIIYQIFKHGMPISITGIIFRNLKQHFEGKDDVLAFMYEMDEIMDFRSYCDPLEPEVRYLDYFDINNYPTYEDWHRKWIWSLDGVNSHFSVPMMHKFTDSLLKSLTNIM
jgi:hypothetical protein